MHSHKSQMHELNKEGERQTSSSNATFHVNGNSMIDTGPLQKTCSQRKRKGLALATSLLLVTVTSVIILNNRFEPDPHENNVQVIPPPENEKAPPLPVPVPDTAPLTIKESGELNNQLAESDSDSQNSRPLQDENEPPSRTEVLTKLKEEMVPIPRGSFEMGDTTGDGEIDEKPAHPVLISSFSMKKTEVTFEQYDLFARETGRPLPDDGGWGRGDRPVINVSWHDANAFAEWLSKETNTKFRLPTEAEWEYAARAGSKARYSWGDKPNAKYANGGEGRDWPEDGFNKQTAPVASYQPNQFGLYDMHGNVLEWTQDCWKYNYVFSSASGRAWEKGDCEKRVRRGGSWADPSTNLRSSERYWSNADTKSTISGFRVVQDLSQ